MNTKYLLYFAVAFVIFLLLKKHLGKPKEQKGEDNSGGGGGGGLGGVSSFPANTFTPRNRPNTGRNPRTSIVSSRNTPFVSPRFRG